MDKIAKRCFVATLSAVLVLGIMPTTVFAQASNGFTTSWSLDPNDHADIFPFAGFGAQSVQAGMDFDGDGRREILFSMDETLAPGGPDPGKVGIYL